MDQSAALMPSTTLQSRISAFESLSHPSSSSSPPSSNEESILETPLSPVTAAKLQPVAAFTRPSPSPSPPNLGRKTSLIDLKDWVFDDGPSRSPPSRPTSNGHNPDATKTPTQKAYAGTKGQFANGNGKSNGAPLISLEASPPQKPKPKPKPATLSVNGSNGNNASGKPPQLPPRKPSYTSLKSNGSGPQPGFLYPPRRTDSLTVDHLNDLALNSRSSSGHAQSSSVSSFHSVSLSSDTDVSTPGSVANFIATFPMDQGSPPSRNGTGSSNGHGSGNGRHRDIDSISLSESYEEVSPSSLASPASERIITLDWEKAMSKRKPAPNVPPKLPDRPNSARPSSGNGYPARSSAPPPPPPLHPISRNASGNVNQNAIGSGSNPNSSPSSPIIRSAGSSSSTLAHSSAPPYAPRRAAPPPPAPPSRSSDRSSILSTTTSHSVSSRSSNSHASGYPPSSAINMNLKARRPTPVPLAARKRYEVLFTRNVIQRRRAQKQKENEKPTLLTPTEARGRRAAGWRGLSVDLITGGEEAPPVSSSEDDRGVDEVVGSDERLEGAIVRLLWKRSGLDSARLAEIWCVRFIIMCLRMCL